MVAQLPKQPLRKVLDQAAGNMSAGYIGADRR
jgi:hypothetical protein